MPRSIHDILDHADELAKRFEDFDPDRANEIAVAEYLLQRAVIARAHSEQQLIETVINARIAGFSWQEIGILIGTSAQAAQQHRRRDPATTEYRQFGVTRWPPSRRHPVVGLTLREARW